jgi:tetratricopeptide (TPR) repeat protein
MTTNPFFVYALTTEVVAYEKLKCFQQAEEIVPEMLKLGESRLGANHPQRVILLNNAAAVYIAEKKYTQAEPLLREAVALSKNDFLAGHPLVRNKLLSYSYVLENLNRYPEAARYRAEAEVLLAFPR